MACWRLDVTSTAPSQCHCPGRSWGWQNPSLNTRTHTTAKAMAIGAEDLLRLVISLPGVPAVQKLFLSTIRE